MYRRKVAKKEKTQPSNEDCAVSGEAVRVAGFKALQC